MSENNFRTAYVILLIEWYIASLHDWNITANKHRRLLRQYLPDGLWGKIIRTFSAGDLKGNWDALLAMADLVTEIGTFLAEASGYEYPQKLDRDISRYLSAAKAF